MDCLIYNTWIHISNNETGENPNHRFHCIWMKIYNIENPWKSMPSTELNITRSVDGCFNPKRWKHGFRYVAHEMMKIAVRIEMSVSNSIWIICYFNVEICIWIPPFRSYNQMNGFMRYLSIFKNGKNTGFSFSISMAKMRILKWYGFWTQFDR